MVHRLAWASTLILVVAPALAAEGRPDVLVLSVDTLRADRLSAYGYRLATSPNLDRLMAKGARFAQARTVEPLTGPALCSMFTSRLPHETGATRNGLRMRAGLASLPRLLSAAGYRTAAIVANWTLRDRATGLGEHFDEYDELFERKRWFGLVSAEAGAEAVTRRATEWIGRQGASPGRPPFLLWVHYVDPHAPYRLHHEEAQRMGLSGKLPAAARYDTEIAHTDRAIGELLGALERLDGARNTLVVLASDHGESLGEHDDWGHGRNLYEPALRIPLAIVWPGHIAPAVIEAPATNVDVASTVLGLLGLSAPAEFRGFDWTPVFAGAPAPLDRVTEHQAHRGAVLSNHDSEIQRRAGLLEVAVIQGGVKEILRVRGGRRARFDLTRDPGERTNLADAGSELSAGLERWLAVVDRSLNDQDVVPPQPLDAETAAKHRALNYSSE